MGRYFGTDGFRGEANVDLTVEHAFKVGRFLGWYYGKKQGKRARVVIGKDTRRSSYMLEDALSCGLTASGTIPSASTYSRNLSCLTVSIDSLSASVRSLRPPIEFTTT